MADLDLAGQIREKKRKLADAEAEVMRLKKELGAAREALLADGFLIPPARGQGSPPMNSTEMAEEVLKQAQTPLHVNDIISAIEKEFHVQVRYATLVGNIARLVKKKKTFERVGPNRFGLIEWVDEREIEELFNRQMAEREER